MSYISCIKINYREEGLWSFLNLDGYRDRPDGGRTRFVPGGILGLIGYCAFLWGVFVALGEGTVALYAVLGLTALLIVLIIVFFNHFERLG